MGFRYFYIFYSLVSHFVHIFEKPPTSDWSQYIKSGLYDYFQPDGNKETELKKLQKTR